jgi:hypothetical protein
MIDEDIVIERFGRCICLGCVGVWHPVRGRLQEALLVCSVCAVAFDAADHEADHDGDHPPAAKRREKPRRAK